MGLVIENGVGNANKLKIDSNNRAHVQAITENESLHASELGDAYNLNTGLISMTGDATVLYIENSEDKDLVIDKIIVGAFEGITHSDDPYVTLVRNPTGGDLISDATTTGVFNQNRNFGSSKSLTANFYKGKVSGTLTGGDNVAIFQVSPGQRNFFEIGFILPKGRSMGLKLTANASSGAANYYAAVVCYLKDPEGKDT